MKKEKKLKYTAAVKELDDILSALETEAVDVEELGKKISRAVELVEYCRQKIEETELEVKKVIAKFENKNKPKAGDDSLGKN